jgi:hypothetical protein
MMYVREYDGCVVATSINKPVDMAEWIEVDGVIPPRPEAKDDVEPRLMLNDGQLVWHSAPTYAEVQAQRAAAYSDRCDPIAHELTRLTVIGAPEERIADARARLIAASDAINAEFPYPSSEA